MATITNGTSIIANDGHRTWEVLSSVVKKNGGFISSRIAGSFAETAKKDGEAVGIGMGSPPLLGSVSEFSNLVKRADIQPNSFQTYTIVAAVIMFFGIFFLWHMPILRDMIAGFKLFVVAIHEFFHILVGMAVGGEIVSICIDPNLGGETIVGRLLRHTPRPATNPHEAMYRTMPQMFWSCRAVATLSAGYLGSMLVGFLFMFASFDIVASKIASFVIGIGLLIPAVRVDSILAFLSIIGAEALMIGLWFGDHGNALRFYVLFVGIMNMFYVVWDYTDERFFDKLNSSDCSQFTNLLGWPTSIWAVFWTVFAALVFTSACFAGIAVFKKTPEEMYNAAAGFLPT